jgi:hypothetical protein
LKLRYYGVCRTFTLFDIRLGPLNCAALPFATVECIFVRSKQQIRLALIEAEDMNVARMIGNLLLPAVKPLLVAAWLAVVSASAQAIPTRIDFSTSSITGDTGAGGGMVLVDSAQLIPGTQTTSSGVLDMVFNLSGIGATPPTTTFGASDLTQFFLNVDGFGNIVDLHFSTAASNADGYYLVGYSAFVESVRTSTQLICGSAGCEPLVGLLEFRITGVHTVPVPATLPLVGLGLAMLSFFGGRIHPRPTTFPA